MPSRASTPSDTPSSSPSSRRRPRAVRHFAFRCESGFPGCGDEWFELAEPQTVGSEITAVCPRCETPHVMTVVTSHVRFTASARSWTQEDQ